MASRLAPCPACTRHVKVGSVSCPFCACAVPTLVPIRTFPIPRGRPLTRAVALFAGATAISACGEVTPSPVVTTMDASAPSPDPTPVPLYGGGVFWDAGEVTPDATTGTPDSGAAEDAGDDVWWSPVEYGPAGIWDAGDLNDGDVSDAGEQPDVGQVMAAYGVFINPDGGTQ